jgi:hypothetical protein
MAVPLLLPSYARLGPLPLPLPRTVTETLGVLASRRNTVSLYVGGLSV